MCVSMALQINIGKAVQRLSVIVNSEQIGRSTKRTAIEFKQMEQSCE